jgi:hypothetical protein
MRALCGAIMTAGALIGLGITALGIGTRYQYFSDRGTDGTLDFLRFKTLDTPLLIILLFLMIAAIVGFGLAVVGLALHHERRLHERAHGHPMTPGDYLGPTSSHAPQRQTVS